MQHQHRQYVKEPTTQTAIWHLRREESNSLLSNILLYSIPSSQEVQKWLGLFVLWMLGACQVNETWNHKILCVKSSKHTL